MIKFEYRPWTPDSDVGELFDPPPVEIVAMTLGDDVSWDEAVCEFHNFLRAAGYVIPYDFEKEDEDDHYFDCSDPPDMDKSGSLGDRQPEWANRMSGPDKWWNDESNTGVAPVDESNTDVADEDDWRGWTPLTLEEIQDFERKHQRRYDGVTEPLFDRMGFATDIEKRLKELNT